MDDLFILSPEKLASIVAESNTVQRPAQSFDRLQRMEYMNWLYILRRWNARATWAWRDTVRERLRIFWARLLRMT